MLNSLNAGNDDPKYNDDDASDTTHDNDDASDTTVFVEVKPTVVYDSPKRIIHRKITCYRCVVKLSLTFLSCN